jgi:hypothetical protein
MKQLVMPEIQLVEEEEEEKEEELGTVWKNHFMA